MEEINIKLVAYGKTECIWDSDIGQYIPKISKNNQTHQHENKLLHIEFDKIKSDKYIYYMLQPDIGPSRIDLQHTVGPKQNSFHFIVENGVELKDGNIIKRSEPEYKMVKIIAYANYNNPNPKLFMPIIQQIGESKTFLYYDNPKAFNTECPICLEELNKDFDILLCGHAYHTACINELRTQKISAGKCDIQCNICRKEYDLPHTKY